MIKQKVVRTYPNYFNIKTKKLDEALADGYKVVMCNTFSAEFIGDTLVTGNEYILEKEESE